jgi:hypothetical protein
MVAGPPSGDRRVKRLLAGVMVAAACGMFGVSRAGAAEAPNESRVLLVTVPNLRAADLDRMPNLRAFLANGGVADTSTTGVDAPPTAADGYLTISTGARAQSVPGNGQCTLVSGSGGAKCTEVDRLTRHNDKLLFDGKVGLLGDELARAGYDRATLLTRDGDLSPVLALAGSDGTLPDVGSIEEFERLWARDKSVVQIDGDATPEFDAQLGRVLQKVDPKTDAVVVASPSETTGPLQTTLAALKAPHLEPGLLRSAFTRHSGIVGLVDVGPTVLDQLGIDRPARMEGRAFEFGRTGGSYDDRLHWLVHTEERSQFRDRAITQLGGVFVGLQIALAVAALLLLFTNRVAGSGARAALELGALTLLFVPPASHLAVLLPFESWGLGAYWVFLGVACVGAALVTYALTKRHGTTALMVALAVMVGVIVIDQLTGAHLQFNAAFGYSPTIGGRFAGLGNLGYAQLAAGGVLLAGLLAHRIGGRRGAWCAAALLVLAIVVDGSPFFGADVGGVLSMVPAFGITIAMLFGWKFRWRLLALFGLAGVAVLGLAAVLDLSRPADKRSHLGRLLGGKGSDIGTVIHRKLDANLSILTASPAAWLLPVLYVATAWFVWRSPGPLRVARDRIPELTPALVGLGLVALLGTLLNDSGIAITGMMFGVAVPSLVFLSARLGVVTPEPDAELVAS